MALLVFYLFYRLNWFIFFNQNPVKSEGFKNICISLISFLLNPSYEHNILYNHNLNTFILAKKRQNAEALTTFGIALGVLFP